MAEGDIIRGLLKSHVQKDEDGFRRAASALIANERKLNHRLLADDLERLLNGRINGNNLSKEMHEFQIPKDKEHGLPLVSLAESQVTWDSLVYPPKITAALQQCVAENNKRELLMSAGVAPKQKILLHGPPGCGKTISAGAIASDLGLPLATVRLDSVMSSFLGQTASNLRRVFDFIESSKFVVLFDECDTFAKERSLGNEHGELLRVVSSLLQMMDGFKGESVIIFATNHQQLLDSALWRRFDLILELGKPTSQDRVLLLRKFLCSLRVQTKVTDKYARAMEGATGADLKWFSQEIIRHCVIEGKSEATPKEFEIAKESLILRTKSLSGREDSSRPIKKRVSRTNPQSG